MLPQVGFTDVQARRLQMWFDGFNESEIAASEGVSRWVVSKSLHLACDKILNEYSTWESELKTEEERLDKWEALLEERENALREQMNGGKK